MTFSKVESMTKTRSDNGGEETWSLLTDGDQRSPCAFSYPQMGGWWAFSPVSCFLEKDHYELCLAEINWITASQVDVVSHSAFTVHLGNGSNQCGLLLCGSARFVLSP